MRPTCLESWLVGEDLGYEGNKEPQQALEQGHEKALGLAAPTRKAT